jgi:AcrR family transcriptional regulator
MPKKTYHHGDLKNALIQAAIEILAKEGVGGLSLRKAARLAGVSHAAPYAHFADKRALMAAVSSEGYRRIHARVLAASAPYANDPLRRLVEGAWAYVEFALEDPAHFRVTLSGGVAEEKDYPDLTQATADSFRLVVEIVTDCQAAGLLRAAPPDLMAVSLWSAVHGLVALRLDGQISTSILKRYTMRRLLIQTLRQFIQSDVPARLYSTPS